MMIFRKLISLYCLIFLDATKIWSKKESYWPYRGHKQPTGHFKPIKNGGGLERIRSQNFELLRCHNISFKDVGGCEEAKEELMQCKDFLTNPEKYYKYNVRVPRGLVLEGPPGTGKTLLAKAFSGECGISFLPVSGSQFQEMYVGVGMARVKEMFQLAQENAPCIIFIDEAEALGRARSELIHSDAERDNTVNQLLVMMDGFESFPNIFLILATNRFDLLDKALVRPGRIDKRVHLGLPSRATRSAVLDIHMRGKPMAENITKEMLLDMSEGLSNAEIENILNEGMLYALRKNQETMSLANVNYALNRLIGGGSTANYQISNDTLHQAAIHEIGHALVGYLQPTHSKLRRVVLNNDSARTPGYTVFEPDTGLATKESLLARLAVLMGGRAAEDVFFGSYVTNGANHDLQTARQLAYDMIVSFGFGNHSVYPTNSNKFWEQIDDQIFTLVNSAYHTSRTIIATHQPLVKICADTLLRTNILHSEEIKLIITDYNRCKETPK